MMTPSPALPLTKGRGIGFTVEFLIWQEEDDYKMTPSPALPLTKGREIGFARRIG